MAENNQTEWDNSYLYKSTTETAEEEVIQFQGSIPIWLHGTLYKNGGGQVDFNDDPSTLFHHAFDGFALIHKYAIDGPTQSVRFRASFVKSRSYKESVKNGRLMTRQFGTDPRKSMFSRLQSIFYGMDRSMANDNTAVNVQKVHNELMALTETAIAYVIDSNTLETIAPVTSFSYGKPIDSQILTLCTAHVMHDDKRNMTVTYATRVGKRQNWLDVVFICDDDLKANEPIDDDDSWMDADGPYGLITQGISERGKTINRSIKRNAKSFRFPCVEVSYMHSAVMSEDYLILTEVPFHFSNLNILRVMVTGGIFTDAFKWYGDKLPTYFRIISLDSGTEVARIRAPPFFQFHHINAYQTVINDKNIIVVDICAYDDDSIIHELTFDSLRKQLTPTIAGYVRRFHLDISSNTCTEPYANQREPQGTNPICYAHSLVPVGFELPRINPHYNGKPYHYFYAPRMQAHRLLDSLIKIDVESKQQCAIWIEPCTSPSEPIFVPRPKGDNETNIDEDDGVVLSIVLDQKLKRSFLLVLDGKTFKELGRAYLPIHIPLSFHGNFY